MKRWLVLDDRATEVALVRVLNERGELSERVRLRVAFDLLGTVDGDTGAIARRTDTSRFCLDFVIIRADGTASSTGEGDSSGAAVLVWEILAGRVARSSAPGRIHDLVDEIHPDIDDTIARALSGAYECVEEFRDALDSAADGRIASHDEVIEALDEIGLIASAKTPHSANTPASDTTILEPPAIAIAEPVQPIESDEIAIDHVAPLNRESDAMEVVEPTADVPARAAIAVEEPGEPEPPAIATIAPAAADSELPAIAMRAPDAPADEPASLDDSFEIDEVLGMLTERPMPERELETAEMPIEKAELELEASSDNIEAPRDSVEVTLESIEEQRPSQVEVPAAPTSSARGLSFEGPPRPRMPALRPPPAVRACAPPPRPETEPPAAETSLPPPIESAAFPTQHATPEPSVPPAPPSRRPLVLVISMLETDDDELAEGLRAQGFDVLVVDEARAGFEMTCRLAPACIVCDMDLPDDGGDRVVLRLRRLSSPIATTPFVLIASHASTTERASRFSAGADVCLLKPYVASTVVLQVVALHQMSARLRDARSALSRFPQATSRAFQGHLEQISLASILTVIDMERRTGVFGVRHDGFQVELVIISGHATHGFVQGNLVGPLEAMRAIATMSKGRFSFVARDGFAPVPEDAMRLGHVLAEATRLADEATAPATKSELNVRTR